MNALEERMNALESQRAVMAWKIEILGRDQASLATYGWGVICVTVFGLAVGTGAAL